jgi:hypothetical protein
VGVLLELGRIVVGGLTAADLHQVAGSPALRPDRVKEVLLGAAEIEVLGLPEQSEREQRLLETGQRL